jgi:hypothetical protein
VVLGHRLITLLGTKIEFKPIQIVQKSIQDFKSKSFSSEDFATSLEQDGTFASLKTPKVVFHYKNIIPIPNFLTKIFIELENKDPIQVVTAFFHAMHSYDYNQDTPTIASNNNAPKLLSEQNDEETNESADNVVEPYHKPTISLTTIMEHSLLDKFIHVIQTTCPLTGHNGTPGCPGVLGHTHIRSDPSTTVECTGV